MFGLVGWSGSGKTTLLVALIPELIRRGLTVSTVKHTSHAVDLDQPGKDSWRHREAGATDVVLLSSHRLTLISELRDAAEPNLDDLIRRLAPVDLVLVEGFKRMLHDKLEVHRPVLGKPLLCRDDPNVVAVATDEPAMDIDRPVFDLNDVKGIAAYIIDHLAFKPTIR
jgi:molybdopterin-guanine dinucleotide biosynthesis protein B